MHDHDNDHGAPPAQPPKNRATRRAHGQRGAACLPVAKRRRSNVTGPYGTRYETGPQRAQRRAASVGLTVGAPVRATVMTKTRPGPQRPLTPLERIDRMARYLLQRDVTTHVRHGSSWQPTPRQRRRLDHKARQSSYRKLLESQRLDNPAAYALAMSDTRGPAASAVIVDEPTICAESATIGGRVEVCTNPQGHSGAHHDLGSGTTWPPTVRQDDPAFVPKVVAALLDPANTVKPERERSAINRNGYRVVDRRGEHRQPGS